MCVFSFSLEYDQNRTMLKYGQKKIKPGQSWRTLSINFNKTMLEKIIRLISLSVDNNGDVKKKKNCSHK